MLQYFFNFRPYEDKLCLKILFSKQSKDEILPLLAMYPEIQVLLIQDCTHPVSNEIHYYKND